jgi:glyoxylase-like metal-dependent hydrolase (beta-lactamase superfamily II)
MKLTHIHAGHLKLDGGAMFGIVPKTMWAKLHPPDANNLCTWAMNLLLIENGDQKILVDTGIGDKQDAKWRTFFEPHGPQSLHVSLAKAGIRPDQITDVLLTHLHFDHCGGAISRAEDGELYPTFPNANYWVSQLQWEWAHNPNEKERASFLKENFAPLWNSGQLSFISKPFTGEDIPWKSSIRLRFVYGHTEAMMLPIIEGPEFTVAYCADLMPSSHHIGMPYVMAYDIRPLDTLSEKKKLLTEALENQWVLMFEHDPKVVAARLTAYEAGRIKMKEAVSI